MLGSQNMNKYFTTTFITDKYNEAKDLKTLLYTKTSLNEIVKLYNTYYNTLTLNMATDSIYLDVKYKLICQKNIQAIHKKIQQQFYDFSINSILSADEKKQQFQMIVDSFCFAQLISLYESSQNEVNIQTAWDAVIASE